MRFLSVTSFLLIFGFNSSTAFSEVRVEEVREYIVHFTGDEAKELGQACGLEDRLEDAVIENIVFPGLYLGVEVSGSVSGSGIPTYRYQGTVAIKGNIARIEQDKVSVELKDDSAQKMFDVLRGVQQEGETKSLRIGKRFIVQCENSKSCEVKVRL